MDFFKMYKVEAFLWHSQSKHHQHSVGTAQESEGEKPSNLRYRLLAGCKKNFFASNRNNWVILLKVLKRCMILNFMPLSHLCRLCNKQQCYLVLIKWIKLFCFHFLLVFCSQSSSVFGASLVASLDYSY